MHLSRVSLFILLLLVPLHIFAEPGGVDIPLLADTVASFGWKGWFTVILFLATFAALVAEILAPDLIMLLCAVILLLAKVVTPGEFLRGFSEEIIFSIAMLCVIVRAMEMSGILSFITEHVLAKSRNMVIRLLSIMIPVGVSSAFINNTPIVLLMTSVVRSWALEKKLSPSKFLIPLSYAAILGGMCTLIGTSSTLIVDGLLRHEDSASTLSFFEISRLGLPLCLMGLAYMLTIGHRLLPIRQDPTSAAAEQTQEFTTEFVVSNGCELIGKTVGDAGKKHFRHELLIEIERDGQLFDSPSPKEVIREGDRLVFAGDIQNIAELHAIEGLRSMADPHFHLDVTSPHFSEVVISVISPLAGKTLKAADFRNRYGASVLAVYRQGVRVPGPVGDAILRAGDTLMLLSKQPWQVRDAYSQDFYYMRHNEELSLFSPSRFAICSGFLAAMIGAVMMGVPLVVASVAVALLLLVTRMISLRQARSSIRWSLLVLIASSFSLGIALQNTGVADAFAELILHTVGSSPTLLIGTLFIVTAVVTGFVTNNAAVLLLFPIAAQTVRLAGYHSPDALKAVGICIAVAASCSFATPIGYQTNMIVYGPGGYKFRDYVKVGLPLTILTFILTTYLIPICWPLH
ncbi:Putative sulfur deprivation response regulator [Chlamydiales bacterium SCGC AG-110-P3]|nr:Putative sulfur deprivation response regulator [Chlamydiales bacterium SCGC AG-110-P3]